MDSDGNIYIDSTYSDEAISPEELNQLEDPQTEETFVEGDFVFPEPLYHLKLEYSNESLYASYEGGELEKNTYVLVPTRYGKDLALVLGKVRSPMRIKPEDVLVVERCANVQDLKKAEGFRKEAEKAFKVFVEKIAVHHLEMKPITAHFLLEEPKILFFFSAENRVDFRNLVKDLVAIFKKRIELRQIGVRDESRITGGLGVCGRPYCCHAVTDRLRPVSIRMAKDQNLSLNSLKISGQCGRLLCCLAYEYEWYIESRKKMPSENVRVFYDGCNFRVTEVNLLTERIRLIGDDDRILEIPASRMSQTDGKWQIS